MKRTIKETMKIVSKYYVYFELNVQFNESFLHEFENPTYQRQLAADLFKSRNFEELSELLKR